MSETALLPSLFIDYNSSPSGSTFRSPASVNYPWADRSGRTDRSVRTPGRFGAPCYNTFFTRETACPKRVKHLRGLLGVPICAVNDDGYFANPRYSFQNAAAFSRADQCTPSCLASRNKLQTGQNRSAAADSQRTARRFQLRRTGPPAAFVPEAWRDELRSLTTEVLSSIEPTVPVSQQCEPEIVVGSTKKLTRQTQYSAETGRLIPTPSRALYGSSRGRQKYTGRQQVCRTGRACSQQNLATIDEETEADDLMLQMLCQILQTTDVGAVQAWLVSAHDREKAAVVQMIRTALDSNETSDQPQAGQNGFDSCHQFTAADFASGDEITKKVDRLLLDDDYEVVTNKQTRISDDNVKMQTNHDDSDKTGDVRRTATKQRSKQTNEARAARQSCGVKSKKTKSVSLKRSPTAVRAQPAVRHEVTSDRSLAADQQPNDNSTQRLPVTATSPRMKRSNTII